MKENTWILILLCAVFAAGCATVPANYVPVMPAPVTSFPEAKPAMVRIPVSFVFPKDMGKHVSDLFKDILEPKMDDTKAPKSFKEQLHMLEIWKRLQEPIFLDKDIWLLLNPATLSWGSVQTDPNNILTASAVLETSSKPEVIFGRKPRVKTVEMPSITPFLSGPVDFKAFSNIHSSYEEANEHLNDPRLKLVGQYLPGTGGQKVMIDHIRLYGSGGKVVVEVKLHYQPLILNLGSKPAKLTLYLIGTPHYSQKEQVFDLPDLDYDIKSSDMMLQIADFLFKDDIRKQIRHVARLRMKERMEILKGKMNKALNRPLGPFIRLSSQMTSFLIKDGFADNEGIEARVVLKGNISLQITWN